MYAVRLTRDAQKAFEDADAALQRRLDRCWDTLARHRIGVRSTLFTFPLMRPLLRGIGEAERALRSPAGRRARSG